MTTPTTLSAATARRIALAAQGFADPPPAGRADARHIRRVLGRVGLLQIDSVNVLCRSHYLPVFARLGDYPRQTLDRLSWGGRRRELFEYWAHEASLVPIRLQPQLRWRMARAAETAWGSMTRLARERPGFVEDVYTLVAERGPIGASAIEVERPRPGTMWNWHDGKIALEWLFYCGRVSAAGRRNFERLYDLTERVIPADILATPTPDRADAVRDLVRVAAHGYGVATERDLRDYFRLGVADTRRAVAELVEAGELEPVTVTGWRHTGYLRVGSRVPRRVRARALLSPFDSLIWERTRAERLFDFRYRIEIYTPAARRVYGYYVLPFLLGERMVARVDLKSDRKEGALRVRAAHWEDGADPAEIAAELAAELVRMAGWLGLSAVRVEERGDLAPWLAVAVRS
ncbi:MAG TPA: crosslink repair DNA glycosylase YcaQ family protein [Mycobacteriales bacterium]|nr:crosslink repair DNA glycosylase YcaQ family protein [Mycobacteriales bacterium]